MIATFSWLLSPRKHNHEPFRCIPSLPLLVHPIENASSYKSAYLFIRLINKCHLWGNQDRGFAGVGEDGGFKSGYCAKHSNQNKVSSIFGRKLWMEHSQCTFPRLVECVWWMNYWEEYWVWLPSEMLIKLWCGFKCKQCRLLLWTWWGCNIHDIDMTLNQSNCLKQMWSHKKKTFDLFEFN